MPRRRWKLSRVLKFCVLAFLAALVVITAVYFPYSVDAPLTAQKLEEARRYYAEAYKQDTPASAQPASEYDTKYLQIGIRAAEDVGVKHQVSEFVAKYNLQNEPVLDIGSGSGYLQDVVDNYTGLDISPNVRRMYHKRFVLGSATALPFPDSSFGGGWSIWVFEHVPNPEQALLEIRRVMKNNAVFFMLPAWHCSDLAAQGYRVRPYSDFDWKGKLIKASIPVVDSAPFRAAQRIPARLIRSTASSFGPTRFHYRLLRPNYKDYWESDSDALNALDRYEMMSWFRSRGDECLNCDGVAGTVLMAGVPLIIRVHK